MAKITMHRPGGRITEIDIPGLSEDAPDYAVLRAVNKARRAKNHQAFLDMKDAFVKLGMVEHSEYHYSIAVNGSQCNYWPTSSKWMYQGKIVQGTPISFMGWLKKRLQHDRC